jgi:hypothetical protein
MSSCLLVGRRRLSNAKICPVNRICPANRKCVLENFRRTATKHRNICPVLGTNADSIPGNTQVRCASLRCKNTCDVEGSGHCCCCCGVKYHSGITCAMVPFKDVVHADGFLPVMLSPYSQDMYCKYKNNIDSCNLEVCDYCKARIKGETLLNIPQEEGDNGSVSNVGGGGGGINLQRSQGSKRE